MARHDTMRDLQVQLEANRRNGLSTIQQAAAAKGGNKPSTVKVDDKINKKR